MWTGPQSHAPSALLRRPAHAHAHGHAHPPPSCLAARGTQSTLRAGQGHGKRGAQTHSSSSRPTGGHALIAAEPEGRVAAQRRRLGERRLHRGSDSTCQRRPAASPCAGHANRASIDCGRHRARSSQPHSPPRRTSASGPPQAPTSAPSNAGPRDSTQIAAQPPLIPSHNPRPYWRHDIGRLLSHRRRR